MRTTQRQPRDVRLDSLRNLTPLYAATLNPEEVYPALRAEWGSVAAVDLGDGVPAWLALDWDAAADVLRNQVFTREVKHWPAYHDGTVKEGSPVHAFFADADSSYYRDGAARIRLRAAVDDVFAQVNESVLRARMGSACDRMLARIARDEATSTDLVPTYAAFVPSLAVAAMFALGPEDADLLSSHARDMFSNTPAAGPAFVGIQNLLTGLIRERTRRPGNDMLSTLIRWKDAKNNPLTDDQLKDTARMIQSAGHEGAAAYATTMMVYLLSHTHFDQRVRGGRLSIHEALDTVLVNASPVAHAPARFTTVDRVEIGSVYNDNEIKIGGRIVHQGEAIVAALGEATASKHRAADPWDTATSRATLAFGASGPHSCPAVRVSRIMIETALETLVHRLPNLRLTVRPDQLENNPSLWTRSARSLPVTFGAVPQHEVDTWEDQAQQNHGRNTTSTTGNLSEAFAATVSHPR